MKGVEVGAQSEVPVDPHQATRQKMIDAMQPLRPMERIDTLKQFLDHDRQVLRVSFYTIISDGLESKLWIILNLRFIMKSLVRMLLG